MKAMLVDQQQNMIWSDVPDPVIKAEEVLVKIKAAGVNRADLLQRQGKYPSPPGCPEWMGLEIAGTITQVGEEAAKKSGKLLMYGLVCRYNPTYGLIKRFVDGGKLGDIYYAEAYRMQRCSKLDGWFCDKTKSGGGELMDAAIHQLDLLLYFMGYPKVKSIRGFTTDVNKDLPTRIKGLPRGYSGVDKNHVDRTIESFASCYITFEGGKNLFLKAAHIANTLNPGTQFELIGDKGGVCFKGGEIHLLTVDENNYFMESKPIIAEKTVPMQFQIRHFLDCLQGKAECISNARQGTELMRIMCAIYESAETGKEILF